jgi:long-chain fatty acid transport protein
MLTPILRFGPLFAALLVLLPCARVYAGGLYMFERGARALSRGGAFVAGADDPSSLWYNPAGLADSKRQVLGDFTLTLMFASFERRNVTTEGDYVYPKVEPKPTPLPIPTLAMSHDLGLEDFTFGLGIFAPNTIIMNWPDTVKTASGTQASPARYSLMGLEGSVLANLALGVAWHGIEGLSIGADVQLIAGAFKVKTALSGCDGFVCTQPERSDFDAIADVNLFPALGVSGVFGVTYDLGLMRLGASAMLPYALEGEAKLNIDLPQDAIFSNASIQGNKANIRIDFPTIVRAGIELRPVKALRLESAFVWEQWSRQKTIDVTPRDITIRNIVGISDYEVGAVNIQRNMRDTWSVRGGYEALFPRRWFGDIKLWMRGGLAYEKGAFASSAMTPLTLDSDKVVLSGGLGLRVHKRVRLDSVIGYIFMKDMNVRNSAIEQPQAIRPNREVGPTKLGNGKYEMDAFFLGGALVIDAN